MLNIIKEQVQQFNNKSLKFANEVIDESINTGTEWQKILEKGLTGGVKLLEKQQDIVFDSLEELKKQTVDGGTRFNQLLDLPTTDEVADKLVMVIVKGTEKATKVAGEITKTIGQLTKTEDNIANTGI